MNNWGRDREVEKPKRHTVYVLSVISPFGNTPIGAFKRLESANERKDDLMRRVRELLPNASLTFVALDITELEIEK